MKTCISTNFIKPRKLSRRYKLIIGGTKEIIKATLKEFSTWFGLKKLARKIKFKELKINLN